MTILGISAFYHDSACAIIKDGRVIAASQEERFTRKRNDSSFPGNATCYCLQFWNVSINDEDAIVFHVKTLLQFKRLLETYYGSAPKGLSSFITTMPVWLKEKLFLEKLIGEHLCEIEKFDIKKIKLLFPDRHLSHAASAFYPSSWKTSGNGIGTSPFSGKTLII